jgi:excisionase family DNA binding protein
MSKKPYMARIGEAAEALGVSTATVRRWENSGKITATWSLGGQRRYDLSALLPDKFSIDSPTRRTVAYARVSQEADRQHQASRG